MQLETNVNHIVDNGIILVMAVCIVFLFLPLIMLSAFSIRRKTLFIPLLLGVLLMACNPTRRLKENELLLVKNEIKFTDGSYNKETLLNIVKQKPNRKILGLFRFHLWLYNTINKEKTEKKKEKKVKQWEAWNLAHPNKKPKDLDKLIFREKLLNIGEEPVIIDTSLTHRSSGQLNIFLEKKGYFDASVKDSIRTTGRKRGKVRYSIHMGEPYKIRNVTDTSADQTVLYYVNTAKDKSLLHPGDNYDEDNLEKERIRLTTELRNDGYYFFNKNYITYSNDSNLNSHQVDIGLYIHRVNENTSGEYTGISGERNHYLYDLNNIYIQTDYNPQKLDESVTTDTSHYNNYIFISTSPYERFKKDVILSTIFFKKGDRFNLGNVEYTYTRISDLNVFRFNNIKFEEAGERLSSGNHLLNAFVQLTPVAMQDVSIEPEGTRSGSNYGIAGNLAYHNKNLFRGAELLEIKLKAAAVSQQSITGSNTPSDKTLFNSIAFGPEMNLSFKRFFFPGSLFKTSRYFNPKTTFTASYNFQQSPDYNRTIFTFSHWFTWKNTQTQRYTIFFPELSNIKSRYVSAAFQENLDSLKNPALSHSFETHIITSVFRGSWEFSDQEQKHNMNFNYGRIGSDLAYKFVKNSFGFYRMDADYRHYFWLNSHNTLVVRGYGGAGIPFNNDLSLPFEKGFYAGGSNDIRAWRYSTLGPGSDKNPQNVEQSGDFKIEGNVELRSELFKFFEGALFADFGNIWTKLDSINSKDIALGVGAGIRFNFGFFIFRVDGAVRIYDPALDKPYKWVYSHSDISSRDINFNFGIGYPF